MLNAIVEVSIDSEMDYVRYVDALSIEAFFQSFGLTERLVRGDAEVSPLRVGSYFSGYGIKSLSSLEIILILFFFCSTMSGAPVEVIRTDSRKREHEMITINQMIKQTF